MSAVQPLSVTEPKPEQKAGPHAPARRRSLAPLEPVSSSARWMLGLAFFALFVAVWAFFTLGGFVSPTFLASPVTMVKEGWLLFTEYGFIKATLCLNKLSVLCTLTACLSCTSGH